MFALEFMKASSRQSKGGAADWKSWLYWFPCRNQTAHRYQRGPHYVVVCDSLEYCASIRNLDAIRTTPNFAFVKGDIRNVDLVRHVLANHSNDTFMHFAARTHFDNSIGKSIDLT
jgi:dTDP-D-glucose 4,6-dehydratase